MTEIKESRGSFGRIIWGTIRGSLKVSFEESLEELFGAILEELLKEFFLMIFGFMFLNAFNTFEDRSTFNL